MSSSMIPDEKIRKTALLSSMGLLAVSLTQPCYCTTATCSDSIIVFLLGWAAIFSGPEGIIWLANPLLFFAWFFLKKNIKVSMFLSLLAFILSLSFLMLGTILDNEAGHSNAIQSYKAGYWLWASSSLSMMLGTFILVYRYNLRTNPSGRIWRSWY